MIRPLDRHLDANELDALVAAQDRSVPVAERLSEEAVRAAQRHIETCQDCDRKIQMHRSAQNAISRRGMSGVAVKGPNCSDAIEWLELAAGQLDKAEAEERMKHASLCGHCGPLLKGAVKCLSDEVTPDEEPAIAKLASARSDWQAKMARTLRTAGGLQRPQQSNFSFWKSLFSRPRPAFAAVALTVLLVAVWIGLRYLHPQSAEQLLAQAYTERRTMEVRIPGAKYAPMRTERSGQNSNFDKPQSLLQAEEIISQKLGKYPADATWLDAKGRAEMLDGNYNDAIKTLLRALELQPDSPDLLTDLGTSYYLRAKSADRPIDYGNAIETLSKALTKNPDNSIALFNRALACEEMSLYTQAVEDWEHYLRVDPQGEWADEARARLTRLKEKLLLREQSQNQPLLSAAQIATAGPDEALVSDMLNGRVEQYLDEAIRYWLPTAFPAKSSDSSIDLRNANHAALTLLAHVLATRHQDSWLTDLLNTAPSEDFSLGLQSLARAAKANAAGDPDLGLAEAQRARDFFTKAVNKPGSVRAYFEEIYALHRQYHLSSCLAEIAELKRAMRNESYPWITAQTDLEHYACASADPDSISYTLAAARNRAQEAGYGTLYLRALGFCASNATDSGASDRAWVWDRTGLEMFWSGQYPAARAQHFYDDLSISAQDSSKWLLAVVLEREAVSAIAASPNRSSEGIERLELARSANSAHLLREAQDQYSKALGAFAALRQDKSIRALHASAEIGLAQVERSQGHIQEAESHITYARANLPSDFDESQTWASLYSEVAELRHLANDRDGARRACQAAILVAEDDLKGIHSEIERLRWKQRYAKCYRTLVEDDLRENDATAALELWEWYRSAGAQLSRTRLPRILSFAKLDQSPTLPVEHEVTHLLPSLEHETVVVYAELDDWVNVWVYDNRGIVSHRIESAPDLLNRAAATFESQCSFQGTDIELLRSSARRLYDLLVGPIAAHLDPNRTLVIEPDDAIVAIPFAALVDPNRRYLVDTFRLTYLPSIGYRSSQRSTSRITKRDTALVVSSPALSVKDQASYPILPSADAEAASVSSHFDQPLLLKGSQATESALSRALAGVVVFHFAGHAILGPGHSGLLLASGPGDPGDRSTLLTADDIAKQPLSRLRLAVLSACSTSLDANEQSGGAGSLARAFLRRGVPDVVATRWSVDSVATKEFMDVFYEQAMRSDPASALQSSMEEIRLRPQFAHPYYWAAFDVFGDSTL